MTYAKIKNGAVAEYPVYEGEIRLRYPNVSFPSPFVAPEGYVPVADVVPPAYDYRKNVTEGTPLLVDGVWTRNWVVADASREEIAQRTEAQWTSVRNQRNAKLAACDWTQLPDAPVDVAAWAEYRQALRDITDQSDPFNIVWPQEPE